MKGILLVLMVLAQDPERFVEKLRSERLEEREAAFRELRDLGPAAAPTLEKAAKDPDPEVAARAAALLEILRLRETLPREVREAFPGVEERLALGGGPAWTRLFLEIAGARDRESRIRRPSLEALAPRAAPRFADALEDLRWTASRGFLCRSLSLLKARDAAGAIRAALPDGRWEVRAEAARALGRLEAREAIPELRKLCGDAADGAWPRNEPDTFDGVPHVSLGPVRFEAARALVRMGERDAAPLLLESEGDLFALNRLRRPQVWDRLKGIRLERDLRGPLREVWGGIARAAGMEPVFTEWTKADYSRPGEDEMAGGREWIPARGGLTTLLDAFCDDHLGYEVILEDDRIRALPRKQALLFWKAWWDREGKP